MFNKLLHRKKKDKKHKDGKASLSDQQSNSSNNGKMNGNDATPSIQHTESERYDDLPQTQTKMSQSSHSQDDLTAEDMRRKSQKMAKKGGKKRHSHIGAMRHHSSTKNGKLKNGKSLGVPGDIKEEDEDDHNGKSNGYHKQNGKNGHEKNGHSKNGSSTMNSASTMMTSSATNKRLEQLMAMRAGKDAKGNRSRSVNVSKQKEQQNKYPKKRRSEVHKEPRRHSMFPDKVWFITNISLIIPTIRTIAKILNNNK